MKTVLSTVLFSTAIMLSSNVYATPADPTSLCKAVQQLQGKTSETHLAAVDSEVSTSEALLGEYFESLGQFEQAQEHLKLALAAEPRNGDALITRAHILFAQGKHRAAMGLSKAVFFAHQGLVLGSGKLSWLRHSIIGMYLTNGQLQEAEQFIEGLYPSIDAIAEMPVEVGKLNLGVPLHTLAAYIHILDSTNRKAQARALSHHFDWVEPAAFFEEGYELSGTEHWFYASVLATAQRPKQAILAHLKKAIDGGFLLGWRFNYKYHPVYWSLHNEPEFTQLITQLEENIKHCVAEST